MSNETISNIDSIIENPLQQAVLLDALHSHRATLSGIGAPKTKFALEEVIDRIDIEIKEHREATRAKEPS